MDFCLCCVCAPFSRAHSAKVAVCRRANCGAPFPPSQKALPEPQGSRGRGPPLLIVWGAYCQLSLSKGSEPANASSN